MSWSVSAHGKPAAVAEKLAKDFANITYLQKEEAGIKDAAAEVVAKALAANTYKGTSVQVNASGSGSVHPADGSSQTVSISVQPMHGFVE